MKVCINEQMRIVPIYKDVRGVYTIYRGKRVYLEEYRGILFPVD